MSGKRGDILSELGSGGDSLGGGGMGVLICGGDPGSSGWISGEDSCSLLGWTKAAVMRGVSNGVGRGSLSVVVMVEVLVDDADVTTTRRLLGEDSDTTASDVVGVASGGGGGVSVVGEPVTAATVLGEGSEVDSGMAGREEVADTGADEESSAGAEVTVDGGWTPLAMSCAICRDCSFSSSTISFCT